jgi:GT2 family glycosyltransferase
MISLVTSLYRSEKYLLLFLKRLKRFQEDLATKGIGFQSIIVANDPTDAELKELAKIQSEGWIKILKVPRENLYASWNRGIRESRFDHVGFWNVDDERYSEAIIEALELFRSGAQLIYFPFLYKRYLKILGISLLVKSKVIVPPIFDKKEFGQSMHCGPFFLFTKKLYQKVGPFDDTFRIAGDFEWCLRASKETDFVRANVVAGRFINEGVSLSGGQYDKLDQETERIYKKYGITSKIRG